MCTGSHIHTHAHTRAHTPRRHPPHRAQTFTPTGQGRTWAGPKRRLWSGPARISSTVRVASACSSPPLRCSCSRDSPQGALQGRAGGGLSPHLQGREQLRRPHRARLQPGPLGPLVGRPQHHAHLLARLATVLPGSNRDGRDCHFAGRPSSALLKRLLEGGWGCTQDDRSLAAGNFLLSVSVGSAAEVGQRSAVSHANRKGYGTAGSVWWRIVKAVSRPRRQWEHKTTAVSLPRMQCSLKDQKNTELHGKVFLPSAAAIRALIALISAGGGTAYSRRPEFCHAAGTLLSPFVVGVSTGHMRGGWQQDDSLAANG